MKTLLFNNSKAEEAFTENEKFGLCAYIGIGTDWIVDLYRGKYVTNEKFSYMGFIGDLPTCLFFEKCKSGYMDNTFILSEVGSIGAESLETLAKAVANVFATNMEIENDPYLCSILYDENLMNAVIIRFWKR